ncbi:MAG: hypothetical protein OEX97_06515 [Acidimicrobiia bacterium]|nr:hypothetical protein [Acidimicrobiia bacterium]
MSTEYSDAGASSSGSGNDSGVALVWIGAALVLASWIIFEVIAAEYFVATVSIVIAAVVLALPRLAPDAVGAIAPLGAFTKVGGYALAFAGVVELLGDIRFGYLDGFVAVLGGLVAYAGYVLAFFGARSIKN